MKFETGGWGHPEYLSGGKWLLRQRRGQGPGSEDPRRRRRALLRLRGEAGRRLRGLGARRLRVRPLAVLLAPRRRRLEGRQAGRADDRPDGPRGLDRGRLAQARQRAAHRRQAHFRDQVRATIQDQQRQEGAGAHPVRPRLRSACTRGAFRPNGPYKPDERLAEQGDRQAAAGTRLRGQGGRRAASAASRRWRARGRSPAGTSRRSRTAPSRSRSCPPSSTTLLWKGIKVPGNRDDERPDLQYCPPLPLPHARQRAGRRRRAARSSCTSRRTALIASVFVNGSYCGGSKAPCTAWDCDVTQADQAGRGQRGRRRHQGPLLRDRQDRRRQVGPLHVQRAARHGSTTPAASAARATPTSRSLLQVRGAGIFETPTLIVAGPAYVVRRLRNPSVKNKELGLEITLHNPTAAPLTVKIANEVGAARTAAPPEKTFAAKELTVAAGQGRDRQADREVGESEAVVAGRPASSTVVTTKLAVGDKVIDVKRTKFGFREWEWKGQHFTLNGVPWHLHADLLHNDAPPKDPEEAVKDWKKARPEHVPLLGPSAVDRQAARRRRSTTSTRIGMPVRRSGIFDGEAASYLLVDDKTARPARDLFDNWRDAAQGLGQGRAQPSVDLHLVDRERDHLHQRPQPRLAAAGGAGDPAGPSRW